MNGIKASVMNLSDYSVSQENHLIKLNQNESPLDIGVDIKEAILKRVQTVGWNRYPQLGCAEIVSKISQWQNVPPNMVLPAPGSNSLIQAIMFSVLNAGEVVLTLNPTFSVYGRIAAVIGARMETVSMDSHFNPFVEELIEMAQWASMVIIANPNNPTGRLLNRETLLAVCEACSGPVVVDEAYAEFSGMTMLQEISRQSNLIVLRTFSKAFSAAGIRLAYAVGNCKMIAAIRKSMLPFNLNVFQLAAFEELLNAVPYFKSRIEEVIRERERLWQCLKEIPDIRVFPSFSNFLLIHFPYNNAYRIWQLLRERRVLLRYFDSVELENCLRVSVGKPMENDIFIQNLREILWGGCH